MKTGAIIDPILKAIALAMGIASTVMGFIPSVADADTQVTLLGIGVVVLAVAALQEEKKPGGHTL
jgi:hypothetical protein